MKLQVFVVYDNKAAVFNQPFFIQNEALAIRGFENAARDESTPLGKNPSDFSLHHIGEYDDETANIQMLAQPVKLGSADQFLKKA